ncbi:type II toxin-antitoxin system Phd/YefM family antitoxin [Acidipropionibacterium virtanenii]|uniref:Antitoxin n=1 Tax=Acidipropionibacterium virtanenii TaxID=2057246 RepID=A0A344UPV7_9ACTN|nr:type II toxin-antitoxin system Phd/YefM family antitoxin [Acidipropionibacterium virtanenii]AXE37305.1 hypothetical protein JS278_00108 [Acidipropionibacterium virtanenii]
MTTISASAARQTLPAQLDRVEAGEQIEITRHGKVVAVLISPEELRHRRASHLWAEADRVAQDLEEARRRPLSKARMTPERGAELLNYIYEGRASR